MAIQREAWRFFDPTLGVPDPASPPAEPTALYQLDRRLEAGSECFALLAPFAYLDRVSGMGVVTPHDLAIGLDAVDDVLDESPGSSFRSDLTSVPDLFTWLVPKTGAHLPAALVHDSMIGGDEYRLVIAANGPLTDGFRPAREVWSPTDPDRSPLSAVDADRIFRDAMADSGTGVIRRWLVWTAVTLRTIFALDGTASAPWKRWYYAIVAGATLFSIAWLGYQATAQIFGWTGTWPCTYELWWVVSELPGSLDSLPLVGDEFMARLVSGGAFALLLPIPAGLLWGRFRAAGIIAGIAFALLFHITIALIVLSAVYVVAETVVTRGLARVSEIAPQRRTPARRVSAFVVGAIVGLARLFPRTRNALTLTAVASGAIGLIVAACLIVD